MTARFQLIVRAALAVLLSAIIPATASAQRVLLLAADSADRADDVREKLKTAGFAHADISIIDVGVGTSASTPTLTQLLEYDAVLTWSNSAYAQPVQLGDVLANYVDQGRGVVQAVFSLSIKLDGRWRTEAYEPFSPAAFRVQAYMSLGAADPHPIMSGVSTFSGGLSFHHYGITPQGCGTVIARWTNSEPLVGFRRGPRGGQIVGLNMYPPSSTVDGAFWNAATDGAMLMANALRHAAQPSPAPAGPTVALIAADTQADVEAVQCTLRDLQLFTQVDKIDASAATPSLASLLQYDSVLTWSDSPYGDSTTLGNVLADYVDQGGSVVQAAFGSTASSRLDGRWRDDGYRPLVEGSATSASGLSLVKDAPAHPILSGVGTFTGGAGSSHFSPTALDAATTVVASWSDFQPLVAVGNGYGKRVVGLNVSPPSADARLMANTLLFAANHAPTADAGDDQIIEATSSAGVSFNVNGTGSDPDGDSLTFSWSGAVTATSAAIVVDVPPPAAPNKTQTYNLTLTVSDGKGDEATDSIALTVRDTTAPVLQNMHSGFMYVQGTSADGAQVPYTPVTAIDAVDGARPVVCLPAPGVFAIGDTVVTCSTSDTRENSVSATFTVRVVAPPVVEPPAPSDPPEPSEMAGKMKGAGSVRQNKVKHEFSLDVSENVYGTERVRFSLKSKTGKFVAASMESCTFGERTVQFSGKGSWKGAAGYRYTVFAGDKIATGRGRRDVLRVTITAPNGSVVANIDGEVSGNITWYRVEKPKAKSVEKAVTPAPKTVKAAPKTVTAAPKAKTSSKSKKK
jgi:hypothetical protein